MASRMTIMGMLGYSTLFLSIVNAQGGRYGSGNGDDGNDGYTPPWMQGGNNNNGISDSDRFLDLIGGSKARTALIAHAAIASAVWVLLIPAGGILLRLNIRSPWILRVHAGLQVVSYMAYIAAVGLGIWLIRQMSFPPFANLWDDSHPRLGLAILALAFFQPILGAVHHTLFKKRVQNTKLGKPSKAPGRTVPGYMHLWLGRILIVLGIINGGLGIRLAGSTPFQSSASTRTAGTVYGVIAAVVAIVYLLVVIRFEVKKSQRDREADSLHHENVAMHDVPPSYDDSQLSLQKAPSAAAVRYT